jgi:hypothetical protein
MVDAFRFFRVVPPLPALLVIAFGVITASSVVAVIVDPQYAHGTIDAVLVLQLFASSSGFAGHARRGHYDLLLTRGDRRFTIAAVHWLMSIMPGTASWLTIATAEVIASGGKNTVGLASGTLAALIVISMISWATTVALPRFAGAIGWLVVFAMALALTPAGGVPAPLTNIVFPLGMVGGSTSIAPDAIAPSLLLGVASIVAALLWIDRTEVPLEAAQ